MSDWQSKNESQSARGRSAVLALVVLLLGLTPLAASTGAAADGQVLDDYISAALSSNLALKQRQFSYEKSRSALAEARGAFLPSVDISSRYTRAGGGRNIEIPVGDLVNPIHGTLNELLGENRFPTNVPNQSTALLREEEQETKVSLTQPIFQPALYYSQRSQLNLSRAEAAARDAYARELVAEVKTAYSRCLQAEQVVALLAETETLLRENLRVSESLFRNDKATKVVVYRAEAELSDLQQKQAEADRSYEMARSYFNFLLNRPLETEVNTAVDSTTVLQLDSLSGAISLAMANREEFAQLEFSSQRSRQCGRDLPHQFPARRSLRTRLRC